MSLIALLAISATTGGVLGGLAPIAQMRLVIARQSSEGISVGYWAVVVAGMSLWLAYGIATRDPALIAANGVALTVGSTMLGVVLWHRPRPVAETASDTEHERFAQELHGQVSV